MKVKCIFIFKWRKIITRWECIYKREYFLHLNPLNFPFTVFPIWLFLQTFTAVTPIIMDNYVDFFRIISTTVERNISNLCIDFEIKVILNFLFSFDKKYIAAAYSFYQSWILSVTLYGLYYLLLISWSWKPIIA